LGFLGIITEGHPYARTVSAYEVLIAALMVSRVPTFSGKNITRVPREYALLVLAAMALFIVLLISFPWETLSILSCIYLLMIPLSMRSHYRLKKAGAS
jgi:CDP-diacylglycerol---serine O-phosphatidyltransferase